MTRRTFLVASGSAALLSSAKPSSIKVGCQANAWPLRPGDFNQLIETVKAIKSLGYAGFECNIRFVRDQFDNTAAARQTIESTGVQFIGAHTSMQEAAHEDFAAAAVGASKLGALYIVMSAAGLSPTGEFSKDALDEKATRLETLAKTCRQTGLRLAYHNHQPEFANDNAEITALAERTNADLVNFLVDAGHGYQGGGDPAKFMDRFSNRIVGCHIKTFLQKTKQVPLGQGDFGFEALSAAIKRSGWTGWLITEEGGGPSGGNPSAVGPDRQYIKQIFGV